MRKNVVYRLGVLLTTLVVSIPVQAAVLEVETFRFEDGSANGKFLDGSGQAGSSAHSSRFDLSSVYSGGWSITGLRLSVHLRDDVDSIVGSRRSFEDLVQGPSTNVETVTRFRRIGRNIVEDTLTVADAFFQSQERIIHEEARESVLVTMGRYGQEKRAVSGSEHVDIIDEPITPFTIVDPVTHSYFATEADLLANRASVLSKTETRLVSNRKTSTKSFGGAFVVEMNISDQIIATVNLRQEDLVFRLLAENLGQNDFFVDVSRLEVVAERLAVAAVPLPATLPMLATGLLFLWRTARKRIRTE